MKKMLILGTSSGIGKSCVEYFKKRNYEVQTVSRKQGATFTGDITDASFRDMLVSKADCDIVVNCVGLMTKNTVDVANINYAVAADLTMKLYDALEPGSDIINISSIGATNTMNHGMTNERIMYNTSKSALSDLCIALTKTHRKDVRVTTVEPAIVMPTDFNEKTRTIIPEHRYAMFNYDNFTPIKPGYIAHVIEWIIGQPRWVNIGRMTIMNNCKV